MPASLFLSYLNGANSRQSVNWPLRPVQRQSTVFGDAWKAPVGSPTVCLQLLSFRAIQASNANRRVSSLRIEGPQGSATPQYLQISAFKHTSDLQLHYGFLHAPAQGAETFAEVHDGRPRSSRVGPVHLYE